MTALCPGCAHPLSTDSRFCDECGHEAAAEKSGITNFIRVRELFERGRTIDPERRDTWLANECQGDQSLFAEVKAMLAGGEDSFMAQPAQAPPPLTTPTAAMPPQSGPYIGPYKLLRILGRGGMGVVHLALRDDGTFRKQVALKLLLKDRVTPEFVSRFKQERQVLASLDHPNIARILDGGDTPDGQPFYAMEYVEGKTIKQYLDDQGASLTGRIKIFQQVCTAVQYLHQNAILHRDLKPENILVSSDGIVKILDFGIAKLVGAGAFANANLTSGPGQLMTPPYASPEQFQGGALHAASDIYSMGVILYELLTGRFPFQGIEEKIAKITSRQEPPPPSANIREDLRAGESTAQLRRAMLGELDSIVLKALKYDPRERYGSANELSLDLQRFLDGQPVSAHRESMGRRSARVFRRSRTVIAVAAVMLLLAGFGAFQWRRVEAQKAESAAREAQFRAKEQELRALLDDLEKRLDAPKPEDPAAPTDRIEDVKKLKKAFASDFTALAARPGHATERDALLERGLRYLDRLQSGAGSAPDLTLEVAGAYQQLGLLQENTSPQRTAALETYRKAADMLSKAPDDAQVRDRLASLRQGIERLGGKWEEAAAESVPPPVEPAPAPVLAKNALPPPTRQPVAQPRVAAAPGNVPPQRAAPSASAAIPPTVLSELEDEMAGVEARIQTAEQNIAPVKANLERQGQTLNADTLSALLRMRSMLDKGRRELASGNAAGAKDSFAVARALADRVLRTVGR